jgi:hypothetical protein
MFVDNLQRHTMRKVSLLLSSFALVWGTSALPAALNFSFTYSDLGSGSGFDDPGLGATRRSALELGASLLAAYIDVASPATVNVQVGASQNDGSGFLASAGSITYAIPGFTRNFTQQRILDGMHTGSTQHGSMTWDFGYNYNYDDIIGVGEIDFVTVAMHELMHVLGFNSNIGYNADSSLYDGLGSSGTTYSIFDQFLTDESGNNLVTGSDTGTAVTQQSLLNDGLASDVYFAGVKAVAANGGELVPIYSPASFNEGSSLGHLDTDVYGAGNYLMTHSITTNTILRELSSIELGMLEDIGYSLSAVPEPAQWPTLLGILGLFVGWRRRQQIAPKSGTTRSV